jgi:hypothetical protein
MGICSLQISTPSSIVVSPYSGAWLANGCSLLAAQDFSAAGCWKH